MDHVCIVCVCVRACVRSCVCLVVIVARQARTYAANMWDSPRRPCLSLPYLAASLRSSVVDWKPYSTPMRAPSSFALSNDVGRLPLALPNYTRCAGCNIDSFLMALVSRCSVVVNLPRVVANGSRGYFAHDGNLPLSSMGTPSITPTSRSLPSARKTRSDGEAVQPFSGWISSDQQQDTKLYHVIDPYDGTHGRPP